VLEKFGRDVRLAEREKARNLSNAACVQLSDRVACAHGQHSTYVRKGILSKRLFKLLQSVASSGGIEVKRFRVIPTYAESS
jgi:hypothetical protein